MTPDQTPEVAVLVEYANENLQLKIENARLRQKVKEFEQAQGAEAEPAAE